MITGKQRSVLRKMANGLDPLVNIGKSGITENIIVEAEETLESKELVKFSVMRNVPESTKEVCNIIAEETNAEIVQVIGRKFVLYKRNEEDPVIMI